MKLPGPDHPVTTEPFSGSVSVRFNNMEIACSERALALNEASYPTVYYIPRNDVAMERFQLSEKVTHCPYKGDAVHFSVNVDGEVTDNAAWSYEQPYGSVAEIGEYLAFYTGKVELSARPG